MPLIKSSSKGAVSENIRREMQSGRPQRQAIAIALSTQRDAERRGMASGGVVRAQKENIMPDTSAKNAGHIPAASSGRPTYEDKGTSGPVPMRHRNKLGATDLQANPNGAGRPSRESTIANGNGKGW